MAHTSLNANLWKALTDSLESHSIFKNFALKCWLHRHQSNKHIGWVFCHHKDKTSPLKCHLCTSHSIFSIFCTNCTKMYGTCTMNLFWRAELCSFYKCLWGKTHPCFKMSCLVFSVIYKHILLNLIRLVD